MAVSNIVDQHLRLVTCGSAHRHQSVRGAGAGHDEVIGRSRTSWSIASRHRAGPDPYRAFLKRFRRRESLTSYGSLTPQHETVEITNLADGVVTVGLVQQTSVVPNH